MLPSPDEISQISTPHPIIRVPAWIPAHLTDMKHQILKNMREKLIEQNRKKDFVHMNQSKTASSQSPS
jgi:hypothetical protein